MDGQPTRLAGEPEPGRNSEDAFSDPVPTPAEKPRGVRDRRRVKGALQRFAAQIQHQRADPNAFRDDTLPDSADQGLLGSGGPRDPGPGGR